MHRRRVFWLTAASLACLVAVVAAGLTPWNLSPPANRPKVPARTSIAGAMAQALRLCGVSADDRQLIGMQNRESIAMEGATAVARQLGCVAQKLSPGDPLHPPAIIATKNGNHRVVAAIDSSSDQCLVFRNDQELEWSSRSSLVDDATEIIAVRPERTAPIGPVLWVMDSNLELGSRLYGRVHQHEIVVINTGDSPLEIEGVLTSCGCTQAKMSKPELAPGETGKLLLAVDLRKQKVGRFDVSVIIKSNNGAGPVVLKVHAKVIPPASLDPSHFEIGRIAPTETGRELVTTFHCDECEGISLEPIYLDPGLQWHSSETVSGGARLRLGIAFAEVEVDSERRFSLHGFLREKNKNKRVHEFVVTGIKLPWIQVTPGTVFVGKLKPGETRQARAQLHNIETGIPEIHLPIPDIAQARVLESSILEVDVTAPKGTGFFRTTVLVRLGTHSINVPVTGIVSDDEPLPENSVLNELP